MSNPVTAQIFKLDVLNALEATAPTGPNMVGAVNWAALVEQIDSVIQKAAPVIEQVAPHQYAAIVSLVADVVHRIASFKP